MSNKLPRRVYIKEEGADNDRFLMVYKTEFEAADDDEETVGIYELKEAIKLKKVVARRIG